MLPNAVTCSRFPQHIVCNLHLKAVCMKTSDEFCHKVRSIPRVPRGVLRTNSQYVLKCPKNQDVRS